MAKLGGTVILSQNSYYAIKYHGPLTSSIYSIASLIKLQDEFITTERLNQKFIYVTTALNNPQASKL